MQYTYSQYNSISAYAIDIIQKRMLKAYNLDNLDEFLKEYNIEINKCEISFNKNSKILILGSLAGKKTDYIMRAKKLGIDERSLEFVDEYEDNRFNVANLEYSDKYTDIILGPMPHKIKGIEDYSSFITQISNNPERYAKAIDIREFCNELKISISSFEKAIKHTRYYEQFVG